MVNFVPGEYIKKDVLSVSDTGGSPPNGSRLYASMSRCPKEIRKIYSAS